ncbi:MAG: rhodanese-like domain-containing protein [Myxococcota bacterium]
MLRTLLELPLSIPRRIVRRLRRMVLGDKNEAKSGKGEDSHSASGSSKAATPSTERPAERPAERPSAPPSPARPAAASPGLSPREVQISPEEIFERRARGERITLIDVREKAELASGIAEGALLIPSGQLSSRMGELPREGLLVLYCASGMRSTNGALFLLGQGFSEVKSLVGGFSHWTRDNGPVTEVKR